MLRQLFNIFLTVVLLAKPVFSQPVQPARYKVGLFIPLYLDSAFDADLKYRYGKSFPKQSIPGLEFYEGAEYALQGMSQYMNRVDVHVYDTRSREGSIQVVGSSPVMDSLKLLIGQVSGTEYLQLANLAKTRNIPFVSATYPNDGGVKENPYVIMVNSKLNTHIQALYNYILRNWGTSRIIWCRRADKADDRIEEIFNQLNQSPGGGVMKLTRVVFRNSFGVQDIQPKMDSTRQNIIIAGSLDENFGIQLANTCLALPKTLQQTLVGMPTWEGIRDLARPQYRHLQMVYSTTFYSQTQGQGWANLFDSAYRKRTFSKPSDMAFKGYEVTHYFVNLLLKYDTALISHLNDPSLRLITEYDFRPIHWSKSGPEPDYFENKRIYILRRQNGQITLLN